jgi:molybdopterin synthase sulfur carrier subunit
MSIEVNVKLFATLGRHMADVPAGTPFAVAVRDGATVKDLVEQLGLPREEVKLVFVNGRAEPLEYVLQANDELGIFPPIGGG